MIVKIPSEPDILLLYAKALLRNLGIRPHQKTELVRFINNVKTIVLKLVLDTNILVISRCRKPTLRCEKRSQRLNSIECSNSFKVALFFFLFKGFYDRFLYEIYKHKSGTSGMILHTKLSPLYSKIFFI